MMTDGGLLEILATLLHKACLSDLHNVSLVELSLEVRKICVSDYSVQDWSYSLSYILSDKIVIEKYEQIDDVLRKCNKK